MERTKQDLPHGREEHLHNEDTDESPPEKVSSVLKELGRAFVLFSPILILTFMVFSMLFILMPMSTQILIHQVCRTVNHGEDCDSADVSSKASLVAVGVVLAQAVPSFLYTGSYGSLSDLYGRKPVLALPVVGMAVYAAGLLVIQQYEPQEYIAIAIGCSFINGCCGGILVYVMAAYAYVSDATRTAVSIRRSVYSLTHACMMCPKIFAPVSAGLLASQFGFTCPLIVILVIGIISIGWILVIPESLSHNAPSRQKAFRLNCLQTMSNIKLLFNYGTKYENSSVPYLTGAFLLYCICIMANILVSVLFVKHRFDWSPDTIGIYEGLDGFIDTLSMLFVPALLKAFVRIEMIQWLQLGIFARILFWILVSLAIDTTMMFAILPLLLLSGPIIPYTRTLLSNSVPQELQARVFSGLSGVECLATLLGPLFSVCYSVSVKHGYAGLTYQVMAGIGGCSLLIVTYVQCSPKLRENLPSGEKFQNIETDTTCTQSMDYDQHEPLLSIDESQVYDFNLRSGEYTWALRHQKKSDIIYSGQDFSHIDDSYDIVLFTDNDAVSVSSNTAATCTL